MMPLPVGHLAAVVLLSGSYSKEGGRKEVRPPEGPEDLLLLLEKEQGEGGLTDEEQVVIRASEEDEAMDFCIVVRFDRFFVCLGGGGRKEVEDKWTDEWMNGEENDGAGIGTDAEGFSCSSNSGAGARSSASSEVGIDEGKVGFVLYIACL
ncbi:unnamed protein product [Calypogeia fissa]